VKETNFTAAQGGALTLPGSPTIPVQATGASLRKVVTGGIFPIKVYVLEVFTNDASQFDHSNPDDVGNTTALASLDKTPVVVARLNFLFGVTADRMVGAYQEALIANDKDALKDPAIAQFLERVAAGGNSPKGKNVVIALKKNSDQTETLYYQDSNNGFSKIDGQQGLTKKVLSIWLGTPVDSKMAETKAGLIKGF
jgi:hypothetical protein